MVGPPKTLQHLRKVEASVRVTCRSCKAVKLYDREAMITTRSFQRRSLEWPAVQRDLPCHACDSHDVRVDFVPFGQDDRELRIYRAQATLMNLALVVLEDASRHAIVDQVCTPSLRLALRVLRPFLADRTLLVQFWSEAEAAHGKAFNGSQHPLRWIVTQLVERGHPVWAEFR